MKSLPLWIVALLLPLGACGRSPLGSGDDRVVIQYKGSDTLVNVAQHWSARFNELDSNVAVAVFGGGTGTGISALINGTADLANASRRMTEGELLEARKNGVEPIEILVGYGAIALFLHADNPLAALNLGQLAEIYGENGETGRWSQLGVTVPGCPGDEIIRVSRQNSSGTFYHFREVVLGKGRDYALGSRDVHGSKDVVELVSLTPCSIGFGGLAYASREVKVAAVSAGDEGPYVSPSVDTIVDGTYPITRPLYLYTAGQPEGKVKEFVDWILGEEGQQILVGHGYANRHKTR